VSDTYHHSTRLESGYVQRTVEKLQARIQARFPDRHLADVAGELASAVPQIQRDFDEARGRDRRTRVFPESRAAWYCSRW
jgi:hypothetical protein